MRLTWVDATRGAAICLVILGHSLQYGLPAGSDPFSNPWFATVYAFHMPLFVVISGYLAGRATDRRPYESVKAHARSLLVPYFSWTVLAVGLSFIGNALLGNDVSSDAPDSLARSLLYPSGTLWFLWVLFACHMVGLALHMSHRWWHWAVFGAALAMLYATPPTQLLAIDQIRWLLPFFVAGIGAVRIALWLRKFEALVTYLAIAAFVALRFLWVRTDSVYLHHMAPTSDGVQSALRFGFRYAIALAGAGAMIGIVRALERRLSLTVLVALGVASLGIYAVQSLVFRLARHLPTPNGGPGSALYIVALAAGVTATAWAATMVLRRWRLSRTLLLGGR